MNWGKGLVIAMICFIVFISTMVVKMIQTSTDLESDDYYAREVNYEQEIIATKNTGKLKASIDVQVLADYLSFKLPKDKELSNVEIKMIRPNDQKLDKIFNVVGTKTFLVPLDELEKGAYAIEIQFKTENQQCMQKQMIII